MSSTEKQHKLVLGFPGVLDQERLEAVWEYCLWNGARPGEVDLSPISLNEVSVDVLQSKADEYQTRKDKLILSLGMLEAAPELKWQIRVEGNVPAYAYLEMRKIIIEKLIETGQVCVGDFADLAKQAKEANLTYEEFVRYFGQAYGVVATYNRGDTERLYKL